MNLNVGIDVSKTKLDFCGMDSDQNGVFQDTVLNRPTGIKSIKQSILDAYKKHSYERIIVGLEATSVYNVLPSFELTNDTELETIGLEVVTLNPKMTHRYSQLYDQDKTDTIDAYNIADFIRLGRYEVPVPRDERHLALQRLTRERLHLTKQITWCKNHFLNNLYFKMNTIDAELPTSIFGATMMTVLTDERYSLDELAEIPLEQLTSELNTMGHGHFGDPEAVAKALKRAACNSYHLDRQVMDSVNLVLGMYANEIRMFSQQLKRLDKSIANLCEATPETKCLRSIPGIGPVYAAGIVAEVGQVERFKKETSLAKYAGLVWHKSQSGDTERQATPRVHSGDQYLRYYLVEAANSVRLHDPEYSRYYIKKYREVPKYQHRRASLLTARKLVRLVLTLMKNHQLYDPAKSV